jgi:NADH-quinone oxidoreductase subunit J
VNKDFRNSDDATMNDMLPQASASGLSTVLFYAFALMTAGSAVAVVVSRNIVRTAVALLFTLVGVSGLYFLLSAEFLAAVQLVVYAGGTLILIIFGVMLTSKSPFSRFEPKLAEVVVAVSVGAVLLVTLFLALARLPAPAQPAPSATGHDAYPMVTLGQVLLGDFLVPFELASVLLLIVMIGAAYLAKGRKRHEAPGVERALSAQAKQWS